LEGKNPPKEKHPFLFSEKIHPRQIRNARCVFSFGVLPSKYSGSVVGWNLVFAVQEGAGGMWGGGFGIWRRGL